MTICYEYIPITMPLSIPWVSPIKSLVGDFFNIRPVWLKLQQTLYILKHYENHQKQQKAETESVD